MLKRTIKKTILRIRLFGVRCKNINDQISIGKYSLLYTSKDSCIIFGNGLSINNYVKLVADYSGTIEFGDKVFVGDYSTLRATFANIKIGAHTMIAQHVVLISTNHKYSSKNRYIHDQHIDEDKKGIQIGADCWIAAGVTVLPGITLGDGAVIGANSVVTRDVPPYAIAVGNPARVIGYRQ